MTSDTQKTILVGVTGCIAAYKSAELVRGLQKAGFRVKVVMTDHATHFVDPLTFRALTHEPVGLGLFDDPSDPIHHISLAQEADLFLIAPCTANVVAKLAAGIADDLLTTTALATTAPIMVAPAMNVHMYENAITQRNLETLRAYGLTVIDADAGYQACGDIGRGRLPEPATLVQVVQEYFDVLPGDGVIAPEESDVHATQQGLDPFDPLCGQTECDLAGIKLIVTAGPTVEPIDPVRYITNRSSGKFGYAIAAAGARRGAEVTLISGPVALGAPEGVEVVYVETAREMLSAAQAIFPTCDAGIFAAAVADVRPERISDKKLKKGINDTELSAIALTENPDVLATMGAQKTRDQVVIGFAAETNDVLENARKKLTKKHADMIVANDVSEGRVFGEDEDQVVFVTEEEMVALEPATKTELAERILDETKKLLATL